MSQVNRKSVNTTYSISRSPLKVVLKVYGFVVVPGPVLLLLLLLVAVGCGVCIGLRCQWPHSCPSTGEFDPGNTLRLLDPPNVRHSDIP